MSDFAAVGVLPLFEGGCEESDSMLSKGIGTVPEIGNADDIQVV